MKHTETIMVVDPRKGHDVGVKLDVTADELVIDALQAGTLNMEILANAAYGAGGRITIEVEVKRPTREGKYRRPRR